MDRMGMDELNRQLECWAEEYECPDFIKSDPVQFPRRYDSKRDVEVSAFLTGWISYGNRKSILKKADELDVLMGHAPYQFIRDFGFEVWKSNETNFYRFYKYSDLYALCQRLQSLYVQYEDLETALLRSGWESNSPVSRIQYLFDGVKGIPSIEGKSACKRLCMFLRWMVRTDSPVDLGVWRGLDPKELVIPLDVHVYQQAVRLQITRRKSADWKTAEEITSFFQCLFPDDPAKGDFALFGEGVNRR